MAEENDNAELSTQRKERSIAPGSGEFEFQCETEFDMESYSHDVHLSWRLK